MESAAAIGKAPPKAGRSSCTACRATATCCSNFSACGRRALPAGESENPEGPRRNRRVPSDCSSAPIRALTAVWLARSGGGGGRNPAVACNREKRLELQDFHGSRHLQTPLFSYTIRTDKFCLSV